MNWLIFIATISGKPRLMLEYLTHFTWIDAVGSAGTIIVAALYFATQMRYLNSSDLLFPLGNLLGSALIAFSSPIISISPPH